MFIRIYALAICFATMVIIAIASGVGLYDIVQASVPSLTVNAWEYQNLQSNDAYRESFLAMPPDRPRAIEPPVSPVSKADTLSEEEITERRTRRLAQLIDNHRRDAFRSLIQALIFILVSAVIYVFHWRLAKRYDPETQVRSPLADTTDDTNDVGARGGT